MRRTLAVLLLVVFAMQLTPVQLLGQKFAVPEQTEWLGQIVGIDYTSRLMTVNIKSQSGPRYGLRVADSVDIGTALNPKVTPGMIARVEKVDDEYWVMGWKNNVYLPLIGTQIIAPSLAAPMNFTKVQVGANIQLNWTAVPGADQYEIWNNSTPGPSGGTILATIAGTSYTVILVPGSGSNLITVNPGFEDGSFNGFQTFNVGTSIVSTQNHTPGGTYSAQMVDNVLIDTKAYPVVVGQAYVPSLWGKFTTADGTHGTTFVILNWRDSAKKVLSSVITQFDNPTVTGNWIQFSGTSSVAPANTAYASVESNISVPYPFHVTLCVDDFSLTGPAKQALSFFAVRAVKTSAGLASPFSPWLDPSPQSAALGNPSVAHMQEDWTNARYQSSNFISQTQGSHIGTDGVDGNFLSPGMRLQQYISLR